MTPTRKQAGGREARKEAVAAVQDGLDLKETCKTNWWDLAITGWCCGRMEVPRGRFRYLLGPVVAVVSVTKYGTPGYEQGWLMGMQQNLGSTSLVAQLVKNPPTMRSDTTE